MKGTRIHVACESLNVSTSGYYAWRHRQAKIQQKYNDLKAVYWQHHARLGAPSLVHDMRDIGYCISERTLRCMLQRLGLRSKVCRKYRHTTDSNHRLPVAPNLLIPKLPLKFGSLRGSYAFQAFVQQSHA